MLGTGWNDGLPPVRMWCGVCKKVSYSLRIAYHASFLDRGIETELCCLLDEGVLEFDGELSVGLKVREEVERRGGELVEGFATLRVRRCRV